MMERTFISQLSERIGEKVRLSGWVQTVRDQKAIQFVVVRDPTGQVQITHKRESDEQLADKISGMTEESAVIVEGEVIADERVKLGGLEVIPQTIENVGPAEPMLPLGDEASDDTKQDWRFLDLRRPENRLIFEVQTTVLAAMREHWLAEGFLEIQSPKLMGSPSEGGAEVFDLEYFERRAYLAQSPQFYKQMAMSAGFERVFEIGPAFRADPSHTGRHATEFTSVDMEMSWVDDVTDVMEFEEGWLVHVFEKVIERHGDAIESTFGRRPRVPSTPFPKVPLAEARARLEKDGYQGPPDGDLDGEGMRRISSLVRDESDHDFVFLTEYPASIRAFYHMRVDGRSDTTKSYDLIYNGLEITTGAQREHRPHILTDQAKEKGLSLDLISFYVDFFRFGCPPHGGFGFGLARFLMAILGASSIRQATFLFRGPTRLSP
jgi:nondiscriminating aspartyl-tRNA synthetase